MLSQAPIIGFVPTADFDRARAFYEAVLGLQVERFDGQALVCRAGGRMIRIVKPAEFTPAPYTILGFEVKDIETKVRQLVTAGVMFERYMGNAQTPDGVWTSPAGDKIAWLKDPDGNVLSLTEYAKPQ